MSALFRKTSVLDKRLKKIQKELTMVDNNIRSLSKTIEKGKDSGELPSLHYGRHMAGVGDVPDTLLDGKSNVLGKNTRGDTLYGGSTKESKKELKDRTIMEKEKTMVQDERFVSYLMSRGFQTARPLRHERRTQRNKAIVMCFFVLLLLFWVLFRFFL